MATRSSITLGRVLPVGALVAGLVLASCGSTPSSSSESTTSSSPASSGGGSNQLSTYTDKLKNAEQATFKATYRAAYNGNYETVTLEQAPPKSYFSSGEGSVINTGTTTYFCSSSSGAESCISESSSSNPLATLVDLFSPAAAVTVLQGFESQVAAHLAGVNVTYSTSGFAGQQANCVNVSHDGQSEKYCVTDAGILAYAAVGPNSFQLESYSTTVAQSDFSLPAGATVETLPSGVSIPSGSTP